MSAWSEVITSAALQPWAAMAPALLLAAARWFGFLLWLPALGGAGVSLRMRLALAILLAIVVLPATAGRLNIDQNQAWTAIAAHWLALVAGELALGSVLGLGVRLLFSALQLAGELIDLQAGLAVQQVVAPVIDSESGPSTAVLSWLAVAAFFATSPSGGDLALIEAMLQQFAVIPVGTSPQAALNSSLPILLVQQTLGLAIRLAGPVLGAMSLISMAAAWLARSSPHLQVGPLVAPVRVAVSLALLTAALPEISAGLTEHFGTLVQAAPAHH